MHTLHIRASADYDVLVGRGLLDRCGSLIAERLPSRRAALISDSTVAPLYESQVRASLEQAGFSVCSYIFPAGEGSKSIENYAAIVEFLADRGMTRADPLIALGGGVTGDMTGFAAATYLRGVPFVQIPTTFLAAADSSTGGKTAVNLRAGKNLAGAFWPPALVLCDCDCFDTLSDDLFADGAAESLKHGLIADRAFFERLSSGILRHDIESVVLRDIEIKRDFVSEDEFDRGRRQQLNFGHTIGHAVEKCSGFSIPHGHAVAIGMVAVSRAAFRMGYTRCDCADAIRAALLRNRLSNDCPFDAAALAAAAAGDKKRSGDHINIICLEEIGRAKTVSIPAEALRPLIEAGLSPA